MGLVARLQVVVCGEWANEWGEEGRLFWTLEYLNHSRVYALYGACSGRALTILNPHAINPSGGTCSEYH